MPTRHFSILQFQASVLSHDTIVSNFSIKDIWILEIQYRNKTSISSNMRNLGLFPFQTPTWAAWLLRGDMTRRPDHSPGPPAPVLAQLWSKTSWGLHQGQTAFPPVLQPFPAGQLQNGSVITDRKLTLWDGILWSVERQSHCLTGPKPKSLFKSKFKWPIHFLASNILAFTCCCKSWLKLKKSKVNK